MGDNIYDFILNIFTNEGRKLKYRDQNSDLLQDIQPMVPVSGIEIRKVKFSFLSLICRVFCSLIRIILSPLVMAILCLYSLCKCQFVVLFVCLIYQAMVCPLYVIFFYWDKEANHFDVFVPLLLAVFHYIMGLGWLMNRSQFLLSQNSNQNAPGLIDANDYQTQFLLDENLANQKQLGNKLLRMALWETRSMELFLEGFIFKVCRGDDDKIEDFQNAEFRLDKLFEKSDIQKSKPNYHGFQLTRMILLDETHKTNQFLQLVNLLLLSGRIAGIVAPLYDLNSFYALSEDHTHTFMILFVWTMVGCMGVIPGTAMTMTLLEGSMKMFYSHLMILNHLISVGKDRRELFLTTPFSFKVNLFDPRSLETWLKVTQLVRKTWLKSIQPLESHVLYYLIYVILFAISYGVTSYYGVSNNQIFSYGYVWMLMSIEIIFFFTPLIYHLYYGYKINSYHLHIIESMKNLVRVYDTIIDSYEDIRNGRIESKRYSYLVDCLRGELPQQNQARLAIERLELLKENVNLMIKKFKEDSEMNVYKFAGVLPCTSVVYSSLLISLCGSIWSAGVKYIYHLD